MITPEVYTNITCALDRADALQQDAANELASMQNNLTGTLTSDAKRATLRAEIETVRGKLSDYHNSPSSTLIDAVRRLHAHVERYHGPINTFLAANSITVSEYFASLSEKAGYKINGGNVGASCA